MASQTSGGTVCGFMCLPSQDRAPSCPLPLYQLPHMGSYAQAPPRCQSVWGTWVPNPKVVVGKVTLANQVPPLGTMGGFLPMVPERLDFGGIEPPGSRGVAQEGTRSGQEAAGQMGMPICLQWPGSRKDIPHQAPNQIDWLDALQRALQANTPTCTMTWRPISRKSWTFVPSRSHTVDGLVQWSWSKRRMGAGGSVLTSGNWTVRLAWILTCYPTSRRPLTACRGPSGSLHSTWSICTCRSRWTEQANHWPHLLWGPWDSMSVIECPLDWPVPHHLSAVDGNLLHGPQP